MPGLAGAAGLAPAIRLVQLADSIEAFHHSGGTEAALRVARERRGTQFDPALVDCFRDRHAEILDGLGSMSAWDEVIALDPQLGAALTDEQLDRALIAFADFGDLNLPRARHLPSPQLTGTSQAPITDLSRLKARGVRIVGHLGRITDGVAQFSGSLPNTCSLADLKMNRLLRRADKWATETGIDNELPPPHRFAPTHVKAREPLELDLTSREIRTVLWATGFRPDHSWLEIPSARSRLGHLDHDGGVVTGAPGLYVLGLPVLRIRASRLPGSSRVGRLGCQPSRNAPSACGCADLSLPGDAVILDGIFACPQIILNGRYVMNRRDR